MTHHPSHPLQITLPKTSHFFLSKNRIILLTIFSPQQRLLSDQAGVLFLWTIKYFSRLSVHDYDNLDSSTSGSCLYPNVTLTTTRPSSHHFQMSQPRLSDLFLESSIFYSHSQSCKSSSEKVINKLVEVILWHFSWESFLETAGVPRGKSRNKKQHDVRN